MDYNSIEERRRVEKPSIFGNIKKIMLDWDTEDWVAFVLLFPIALLMWAVSVYLLVKLVELMLTR